MSLAPIDYYDAEKWHIDEERQILLREEKAISIIKSEVAAKGAQTILDVGCGNGQFLSELSSRIGSESQLHGVDYSEYKVKNARKLPFIFKQCNLEVGIPYDDEAFDIVYSGEVIEHIYNPDFMLEECNRVLKPGGLLIISTPNLQSWYNRFLFLFGIQPLFYEVSTKSSLIGAGPLKALKRQSVPVGHLRVFNRRGLVDLVVAEGFVVRKVMGATFQSLPRPVQVVDALFNGWTSMASNLIVVATKANKQSVK